MGAISSTSGEEPFKKKTVDKIVDFDAAEGDVVVIADEVIDSLDEDPEMAVADTKKELKQLSKEGYDLVYFEDKVFMLMETGILRVLVKRQKEA